MKRIALSLAMIALVGSVVIGATSALFSDQGSVSGNTVATGTLDLTLNKSAGKPFSISNAYPGYQSGWEHMDIYNTGSLPFEANMTLNKTGGNDALWNYVRLELRTSGWDSDCTNGDAGEKTIWNSLAKNFPAGTVVSDIAYWHLADENDGSGPPDNIRPGYSERVCQRVGVDNSADNSVQGMSVTFDEVVDAVQDND